jgi:hypothetical protein
VDQGSYRDGRRDDTARWSRRPNPSTHAHPMTAGAILQKSPDEVRPSIPHAAHYKLAYWERRHWYECLRLKLDRTEALMRSCNQRATPARSSTSCTGSASKNSAAVSKSGPAAGSFAGRLKRRRWNIGITVCASAATRDHLIHRHPHRHYRIGPNARTT